MGKFYDHESISVSATPAGLTRAKIDNADGSRAERAVIQVKSEALLLSFSDDPSSTLSFNLPAESTVIIEGYDNLIQALFVTESGDPGTLYAAYEN